ncbi:pirin family protein [Nostocoides vanveenii]
MGAWCFVDHYGPAPVGVDGSGGMDVPPHPHTGLQTVSWLFDGEIEHRDSGGNHAMVRPGEVNLMTGGRGIAHSEVSTPATHVLHGVQLWVALPEEARQHERSFEHFAPQRAALPGEAGTAYVFLGALGNVAASPVKTHTPLLGAQLDLVPGAMLDLRLDPAYEHGVLLDIGALSVAGRDLAFGDLACFDAGRDSLTLAAGPAGARVVLLGGLPFEEEIVMWWNFVARTHDEIVEARDEWEASSDRFGDVPGYAGAVARIPAPPLPSGRLRSRNRSGRT